MNRQMSVVLLVIGIVLLIFGISAADSFGSEVSEFFTGSPTNKTIWLVIGGIACVIVGLLGFARKPAR